MGRFVINDMALQALVVSRDPNALDVLAQVCHDLSMDCRTAENPAEADTLLGSTWFDALVVDCDGMNGAKEVLSRSRRSSAKSCTAFALVNGKTTVKDAFLLGANYVMEKPLDSERARMTLRSAINNMLRERRRYSRQALDTLATIWHGNNQMVVAKAMNISEGGIAVELPNKIRLGTTVRIEFDLPGHRHIEAKGEVAWADSDVRVGIKLLFMPATARHDLDNWLVDRLIESERKQPFWATEGKVRTV